MVIKYYRADYIDKFGKIHFSYSFQAPTNALAKVEARNYKKSKRGEICQLKTVLILTGKDYPGSEPEKPRERSQKRGINKFNR